MAKINQDEYRVLKNLNDKWEWIARDNEYNSLNIYSVKPIKTYSQWDYMDMSYEHAELTKEENKMFQFIQWTDEEPHYIPDLIDEYKLEQEILARRESISKGEQTIPYEIFDENDKLEILSKEWIDKHSYIGSDITNPIVYADDLEGLLVPKQELPVIPQCVANYLEDMKGKGKKLLTAIRLIDELWWDSDSAEEDKAYEWLNTDLNDEIFVKAWIDGYTVKEKEPKYYAKIKRFVPSEKEITINLSNNYFWSISKKELRPREYTAKPVGYKGFASTFTLKDWEKLGIDETNADFVEVK